MTTLIITYSFIAIVFGLLLFGNMHFKKQSFMKAALFASIETFAITFAISFAKMVTFVS